MKFMESKPLTDRQFKAWLAFQYIRLRLIPHLARHLSTHSELTEAEYMVLVSLYESDSPAIRARDLCHEIGWETSRLSHQITRMEAGGLVKREASPDDARGFQVRLTASGRKIIEKALPLQNIAVKHCFADVLTTEQLDCMIEISEAITKHLQEEHGL
jgi:DNA-binding MarR family transcriptional regulator